MVLGNIDIERLRKSKQALEGLKATKLAFVAHKHINEDYHIFDLHTHLKDELREIREALNGYPYLANLLALAEEIADASNVLDIMFDYVEQRLGRYE